MHAFKIHPDVQAKLLDFAMRVMSGQSAASNIVRDGEVITRRWGIKVSLGQYIGGRIHRYVSCVDEEPHDHPWDSVSVVLRGSFKENVFADDGSMQSSFVRMAGDVVFRPAETLHSVVSVAPETVTMFLTAGVRREWGFLTGDGWMPWAQYNMWKNEQLDRDYVRLGVFDGDRKN